MAVTCTKSTSDRQVAVEERRATHYFISFTLYSIPYTFYILYFILSGRGRAASSCFDGTASTASTAATAATAAIAAIAATAAIVAIAAVAAASAVAASGVCRIKYKV